MMVDQILSKEPGFNYFTADKGLFQCTHVLHNPHTGSKIALIVNNLGGTSNLELAVMANAAIRYLGEWVVVMMSGWW